MTSGTHILPDRDVSLMRSMSVMRSLRERKLTRSPPSVESWSDLPHRPTSRSDWGCEKSYSTPFLVLFWMRRSRHGNSDVVITVNLPHLFSFVVIDFRFL